jgi:hypothetical protein
MRLIAAIPLAAALLALGAPCAARADATLLAATAASTIGAQATASLVSTPYAGLGVFASRWNSQDYGTLTGYGLRLGWNPFHQIGLEARASYLESDDDRVQTTLIPLEAALTWRFPLGKNLAPYLGGGIGYYLKDAETDNTTTWDTSEKSVGYFALAGLNLSLGAFSLFVEAKYTLVSTDEDPEWHGSDARGRNSFDGLSYNAGLKLGF